jgi:hypothetical protein
MGDQSPAHPPKLRQPYHKENITTKRTRTPQMYQALQIHISPRKPYQALIKAISRSVYDILCVWKSVRS